MFPIWSLESQEEKFPTNVQILNLMEPPQDHGGEMFFFLKKALPHSNGCEGVEKYCKGIAREKFPP